MFCFALYIDESEETFSTFVVPNSVILSRRQTEILTSFETRQGQPFCLNDSGIQVSNFLISRVK